MADHASHASSSPASGSFLDRHHFLLRRLHSLSGIVPVGVFVIFHLFANFQMFFGEEHFQKDVEFIHGLPALFFIELALWGGIGFHAALGLVYTFTGTPNTGSYRYLDNWRYTLQRVTGIIALIFIFLHVATLRWRWDIFGWFTPFYGSIDEAKDVPLSMPLTAYALQFSVLVLLFYVVGVSSVVYHWSNGLWTAAITWGLTITQGAQKRWGYACAGLGALLTVFFVGAIVGSVRYDLKDQPSDAQVSVMLNIIKDEKLRTYWTETRGIAPLDLNEQDAEQGDNDGKSDSDGDS